MSNYAIGDIQGCFSELIGLLDLINFDKKKGQAMVDRRFG